MLASLLFFSETLRIGSAAVSLVPPEPLPLGGYTARKDAVFVQGGDGLYARARVFEQGSRKVALVSLEMLTVPESLVAKVKGLIPPGVNLMMVATHTHCAPDSQMLNDRMTFRIPGIATYSRKWETWYSEKIAECVKLALSVPIDGVTSVEVRSAEVDANRGRRDGASPDQTARYLRAGKTELLSYSAHATLHDEKTLTLSGDWPGEVMKNPDVVVLPGAIGDVSPRAEGADSDSQSRAMAQMLIGGMKGKASTFVSELKFGTEPIELGQPMPHPDFAKNNGINDGLAQLLVGKFAPQTAELTGLVIGKTLIVGVPGEPTSELGKEMQKAAEVGGFENVWVVSHCNGWVGYILMPNDYKRGGYEASLAMHGGDLALRVVAAAERLAKKLAVSPRLSQQLELVGS